ncbi:unnamed protein product [Ambrosiozyma monospora]|uniref:Unnamed protein product n=1 Tax=Ambrosiozyma monospora TaxID=43982 RepID=A0ACB5TC11_AMBMO|nr:unnamed protein product [Ambrosiozyma monospora]
MPKTLAVKDIRVVFERTHTPSAARARVPAPGLSPFTVSAPAHAPMPTPASAPLLIPHSRPAPVLKKVPVNKKQRSPCSKSHLSKKAEVYKKQESPFTKLSVSKKADVYQKQESPFTDLPVLKKAEANKKRLSPFVKLDAPKKVEANKKQGSPHVNLPVPKKVESKKKTTEKKSRSSSPKTQKTTKNQSVENSKDKVASRVKTLSAARAGKQPLTADDPIVYLDPEERPSLSPDDDIFREFRQETIEADSALPKLLSLFTNSDSDALYEGSSSGWTPETLYANTPNNRAITLLTSLGCTADN